MQKDDEKLETKELMEMTSDELLEYVVAPEVAEKLKARVREPEPCDEPEDPD